MSTSHQPDSTTVPMRPSSAQPSPAAESPEAAPAPVSAATAHTAGDRPGKALAGIPVQIEQKKAREKDLGSCVITFHGRPFNGWDLLRVFLPGILAVALPLYYGVMQANSAYLRFGPVSADFRSRPWFLLAGVGLLAFSLLLILRWWAALQFVAIHRNGLRYRLGGLRTHSLLWNEISGISVSTSRDYFLNLPLQTHVRARINPVVGGSISLDEPLQDLPELISRIKAFLYPRLLNGLQDSLAAGNWVSFGPVAIQSQKIRLKKREIPWTAVRGLRVKDGRLLVELKDQKTWKAPVSDIPNLEMLLQMIQQQIKI